MRYFRERRWKIAALLLATISALGGASLASTGSGLEFDDAGYLTRGYYHAAQVGAKENLFLLRLPWSLRFETPKPPLYTGFLAILAHWLPRPEVAALMGIAALVPLAALLAGAAVLAGQVGGLRAPLFAIACLLSAPLLLALTSRLLVETSLAALVLWTAWAALRRRERAAVGWEAALGAFAGMALLTKLLAPLFVGPVLAVTLLAVARREGRRAAVRLAAIAGGVTVLVCALWYQRNLVDALAYAREASHHAHSLDAGRPWTRPARLLWEGFGGPLLAGVIVLAAVAFFSRREVSSVLRPLRWMALSAGLVSASVIVVPPVFDPRFWAPAVALIAVWAACEATALWEAGSSRRRAGMVVTVGILVAFSTFTVARTPRWPTPWKAGEILSDLAAGKTEPLRLCTLGAHPAFNVEKVRLVAEWSGIRPRPICVDILRGGHPEGPGATVGRCDLLFVLDPDETLPIHAQQLVNVGLRAAREGLRRDSGELRLDSELSARLGSTISVEVYRRDDAATAPKPTL